MIVEPSLRAALEPFEPPLAFLDFETINPAVPVWDGCHPYDNVPVQFSCHRQAKDGSHSHDAWLADGPGDPRPGIAAALIEACAGAKTIVAYNASFEKTRLRELGEALGAEDRPRHGGHLPAHRGPAAGGARPRLPPRLRRQLQPEGRAARAGGRPELRRAWRSPRATRPRARWSGCCCAARHAGAAEKARLREALLRYCELDTWATVKLLERLRELAGS